MAVEIPGLQHSYEAGADLSALQYCFVKLNSSGQVVAMAAVTDRPFGILQDKPAAAGRACNIMHNGVSKLVAGANLAKGDAIGSDATGKGVAYVPGTDTTKYIVGTVSYDENTVSGGLVSVSFDCLNAQRGA